MIQSSGNAPFRWAPPDGYPDTSDKWQAVSPLAQVWRTLSRLPEMQIPNGDENNPDHRFMLIQKVTLAQFSSEAAGTTVNAVVDFWIQRIFGYRIAPERRSHIVRFMGQRSNVEEAGAIRLRWDNVSNRNDLSRHYTLERLRVMVALLMMSPEFYHR